MSSEPIDRPIGKPASPEALTELAAQSNELVAEARRLKALARKVLAEQPCWDAGDVSHETASKRRGGSGP